MARPPGNKTMKKPLTMFGVLLLLLVACAQPDTVSVDKAVSDKRKSVLDIIDAAQTAHQMAIDQDHAWTKTSQFIASAKDKLARGDESAARADAQRALFIANASVAQADRENNAWIGRVPHL
jgi:hypothetical protein